MKVTVTIAIEDETATPEEIGEILGDLLGSSAVP
jgi:hypothetical protein